MASNSQPDINDSDDELEKLLQLAQEDEKLNPKLKPDDSFAQALAGTSTNNDNVSTSILKSLSTNDNIDSSDDEDARNFLERKYNEYGCDINKKLKQQRLERVDAMIEREVDANIRLNQPINDDLFNINKISSSIDNISLLLFNTMKNRKARDNSNNVTPTTPSSSQQIQSKAISSVYTDPVFGLRLVNPLISSSGLIERMAGKSAVGFSSLAHHIQHGDLSKDWVIAGAIVSKSPVKTTAKGASYSIWKLSDLKGAIKTVTLFLFKSAYKELWKTSTGMVIAILNPSVFEKREERSDIACLSIDHAHKVMLLGQSKDLGTCKSKKKNGEPCTALVNLTDCEYCVYHVKQEFSQMSKRSELQSSTAGRGLAALRNKVLGKNEVFYGGQSYTAIPAKKSAKQIAKDQNRLMKLSDYYQSPNAANVNHISIPYRVQDVPYARRTGPISKIAGTVEVSTKQRIQDLERLRILKGEDTTVRTQEESSTLSNETPISKLGTPANIPDKFKNKEFSFMHKVPTLSQEDFSIEVSVSPRQSDLAKQKALELIKKKPLRKSNPNFIKYRGTTEGKRRAIDDLNNISVESKKAKLDHQMEEDRKSRIQKIIDATSSHTDLIRMREDQEQEKYFNKLEKKEALEEKMLSTFKVPCKAVICLQCKYTSFSAADRCKEERHRLKVIDTEKRFFQCEDCGNRTVSVHKMPKLTCKNCQGSRWKRAAMIRERKNIDPGAGLSVRGDEEKFLGSSNSSANLNLLVPEE